MGAPSTLYFLPGALGRTEFWQPASALLPQAELHVFPHGEHDVGCAFAGQVASLIDRHLAN